MNPRVGVEQTPIIAGENVAALPLGQKAGKVTPSLREYSADAVKKPLDLIAPAQKYPAQHEPDAADRVGLGVMQRQCRAPGSTKYQPFVDTQRGAQVFDIG